MRVTSLSRRIVQGVLLLFLPPTAVAAGVLVLLYALRVHEHPAALLVTLLLGGVAMILYLGFMIHGMAESLVATLREIRFGAELIATVDPTHRLAVQTGDELESLADAINRMADRLAEVPALAADVACAVRDLESERDKLEAVLGAVSTGILVVAGDGRVSLANPAAHYLLDRRGPSLLGRNLGEVVREADWPRLRDALREAGGVPRLTTMEGASGGAVQAVVTPLAPTGDHAFVLTLHEVSQPAIHSDPVCDMGSAHRSDPRDRDRRLAELDCVVLDGETTGFDRDGQDRIVSLAAVRVRRGVVRRQEVFDTLVNPGRAIPPSSAAYHGVTDEMVAKAPHLDVVLPAFLRFADGAVLAGHEVWFDLHFLSRESRRLGLAPVDTTHPVLDTALLAKLVEPHLADQGLDGLAHRLGISIENRHSALGDALATAEVYVRLVALLASRGVVTLRQALEASAGLRPAKISEGPTP